MERNEALIRLALVPGLGPVTIAKLLEAVEDPRELFTCTLSQLQRVDGVGPERARRLLDPNGAEAVVDEFARCAELGVRLLTIDDDDYPRPLRELSDPPVALWIRGEYQQRDQLSLSIVGPRQPTASGHRHTRTFAMGLARAGACVVSGLARGIDTVAHEGALNGGGRTVAVIGSGIAQMYPPENLELAAQISDGRGCIISELPLGTRPSSGTFPRRNRLVAALGLATFVIEAGYRSGALITARLAGELGREVLALPGPIDRPEHVGSNRLLRDGATLITSLDDIFEEIAPLGTLAAVDDSAPSEEEHPRLQQLNDRERSVYKLLSDDPRTVDDLQRISSLPASAVSATLISLELRRLARKQPSGYVKTT